jgi:hypothetical protein
MSDCYESRDIEQNGKTYRVEFIFDSDMGAPWEEHDGHGIVSGWESRDKKPGEVVISSDHGRKRFYDVAATTRIAKRDGWGVADADTSKITPAQITALAVQRDMERMRDWCNDVWHWCGVAVFPLTEDGDELRSKTESLWGIESDADDYIEEVISDLIAQISE